MYCHHNIISKKQPIVGFFRTPDSFVEYPGTKVKRAFFNNAFIDDNKRWYAKLLNWMVWRNWTNCAILNSFHKSIMICETKTVTDQTVFQLWFCWSIVSNTKRRKMTLTLIFAWTIECTKFNYQETICIPLHGFNFCCRRRSTRLKRYWRPRYFCD